MHSPARGLSPVSRTLLIAAALFAGLLGAANQASAANPATQDSASQPAPATDAAARSPQEIHWNLVELDGSPVAASTPENQPYIYLQAQGDKLSGSLGCNRLFGSYDLSGSSLQFHSVASTQMACANASMGNEARILEVLKLATNFQIAGDVLWLRVDDHALAKFQPEKPKQP